MMCENDLYSSSDKDDLTFPLDHIQTKDWGQSFFVEWENDVKSTPYKSNEQ